MPSVNNSTNSYLGANLRYNRFHGFHMFCPFFSSLFFVIPSIIDPSWHTYFIHTNDDYGISNESGSCLLATALCRQGFRPR